jgi:membrane-associated phospholipid phosphatase
MSDLLRPLRKFFTDGVRVYAPRRLPWHLLAFGLTFAIVTSGLDSQIVTTFRSTEIQRLAYTAGRVGLWTPVAVPLAMLAIGLACRHDRTWKNAWLLAESEILAVAICAAHKAVTGRPGPRSMRLATDIDTSHVFRFGFLRGGVFWGWPSSHVMVAFAGAVVLMLLYHETRFVKWLAPAYAAYMAVSVAITFHWFSDVVAGAIIGALIGVVVGTGGPVMGDTAPAEGNPPSKIDA